MSLSSFSMSSLESNSSGPKLKIPYHERVQIMELPTAKDMSQDYIEKRKHDEEERMKEPKNFQREEDPLQNTQTVLAVANLFPASEQEKILQQSEQIINLQKNITREQRREDRRAKRSLDTIQSSPSPQVIEDSPEQKPKDLQLVNPSDSDTPFLSQKQQAQKNRYQSEIQPQDGEQSIKIVSGYADNSGTIVKLESDDEEPLTVKQYIEKRRREDALQIQQLKKQKQEEEEVQEVQKDMVVDINLPMEQYLDSVLQTLEVSSRCMKCHGPRQMVRTYLVFPSNEKGRTYVKGYCVDCEMPLSRFAPKEITAAKKSKLTTT